MREATVGNGFVYFKGSGGVLLSPSWAHAMSPSSRLTQSLCVEPSKQPHGSLCRICQADRRCAALQIRRIVEGEDMPRTGERQTLLFSATFPKVPSMTPVYC